MSFVNTTGQAALRGLLGIFVGLPYLAFAQVSSTSLTERLDQIDYRHYYTHPDSAILLYNEVAAQAQAGGYYDVLLGAHLRKAWCALQHSRIDSFQQYLRASERVAQRYQKALDSLDANHTLRANIPYTWGLFYDSMGDPLTAITAFRPIVSTPHQYHDSMLVSDTYYELGLCYHQLENYQRAIDYRQLALQWLPRQTLQQQFAYHQALLYIAIGSSYDQQPSAFDSTNARQYYDTALRTLLDYDNPRQAQGAINANRRLLADWYLDRQQYDSALWQVKQILRPPTPATEEVLARLLKGTIYRAKSDYPAALKQYERALAATQGSYPGKHPEKAQVFQAIGQTYLLSGQLDTALSYFQQSLTQLVENPDTILTGAQTTRENISPTKELVETLSSQALTLYLKNQAVPQDTTSLLQAGATYRTTIEMLDQLRQTFPSLEYKQFLSAKASSLYEQAIRASLRAHELGLTQQDFLAEAFYFSEKGKAATLLEAVRSTEARSFAGIPDSLLARENELKRRLTYWENELYQARDDSARHVMRNRAFETREAYNALVEHLEEGYPTYYQLKYDTEVVSLKELRKKLSPDAALLSFSYGDSVLYSFVVRASGVTWHSTPLDSAFHRRLENVLQTISRYDYQRASDPAVFRQFTEDAHRLYQTLVQPALAPSDNPVEQLIVIPDGLLGYLPFDVLLTNAVSADRVNYQSLPYLVRQLPVSYEYSATLLTNPPPAPDKAPYSYLGFAPSYPEVPLATSREVRTTLDGQLLGLGPLRYNREEVAFAAELFGGQTFTDEAATEAQFKQYAGQSRLLHLSMHAFAHDENDDFSGLIFTQQADSTTEDGFLYSNELYNLSLNAELAVLSACETGIGTLAPGEGIMSLGRAFKYAGCPSVTMSLWNADDQSTSRIMQQFFGKLRDDLPKDKALQQAKLSYLNRAKSAQAHPYYWAAFVSVGSSAPLTTDATLWWWGWPAIGGALILLLLGAFCLRRFGR